MSTILTSQDQFNQGEISPRLYGRVDIDKYEGAVQEGTNCYVTVHGPIIRRPGTKFVSYAKEHDTSLRLGRFQFAKDDAFIIEMGENYFRFFGNNGQITESSKTITGITAASPGVVTSNSHGYSNGDHAYITGVIGMTEINNSNIPYIVAGATTNTFTLTDVDGSAIDTTSFTAYSSGGIAERIYELVTPWTSEEAQDLTWVQKGNLIYFAHPSYEPRIVTRASSTDWSIETLSASPGPLYEAGIRPAVTITPAATSGNGINFTASGATWLTSDVGRQIINESDNESGRATIVSITSTTVAVCDIIENFTDTSAIDSQDWLLDLSPICDLSFQGIAAGQIVTVKAYSPSGDYGPDFTMTACTKANPGVFTTSANHGYSAGDVVAFADCLGMTELNDIGNRRLSAVTATTGTIQSLDTTNYVTFVSGKVKKILTAVRVDAFRASDVGRFIIANGGVMKITSLTNSQEVKAVVLKSLTNDSRTGNWTMNEQSWDSTRGYPRAVGIYQDRLVFGGTEEQPQTIWFSETGIFDGFGIGPDDDDAIDVTIGTLEANQINWIAGTKDLVVGTAGGEITINGGGSGNALTADNISMQPRTYYGSERQQPKVVGSEVLFLQQSGRKVRTFRYNYEIDTYEGEDLLRVAEHMTEGGVSEITYSQEPDNRILAVLTDGGLLVGAYDRAQTVLGWTRFTTDGDFKSVQTVSEGEEDQIWAVVSRQIDGNTRKMIEYFDSGDGIDDTDGFSDSFLTLSNNKTITGISNASPAVVTSTAHGFSNGDVIIIKDLVDPTTGGEDEDSPFMSDLNGNTYTVAGVTANTFQLTTSGGSNINTTDYNLYGSGGNVWKKVTSITGLDHLEGRIVQVKGDGALQPSKTVTNGSITASFAGGEFVVGLKYETTVTTLRKNFDLGGGPMQGQRIRHVRPIIRVYRSTIPLLNGQFLPSRRSSDEMNQDVPLFSGDLEYGPLPWGNTGQITLTVDGPFPFQLLSILGAVEGGAK